MSTAASPGSWIPKAIASNCGSHPKSPDSPCSVTFMSKRDILDEPSALRPERGIQCGGAVKYGHLRLVPRCRFGLQSQRDCDHSAQGWPVWAYPGLITIQSDNPERVESSFLSGAGFPACRIADFQVGRPPKPCQGRRLGTGLLTCQSVGKFAACRLGSRRYSRLGSLRHQGLALFTLNTSEC